RAARARDRRAGGAPHRDDRRAARARERGAPRHRARRARRARRPRGGAAMSARASVALLAAAGLLATGVTVAQCPPPPVQREYRVLPGHPEPHTPGSGAPEELPASLPVQRLLGPSPDLNRVTVLRHFLPKPSGAPPRVI